MTMSINIPRTITVFVLLLWAIAISTQEVLASDIVPVPENNPHFTEVGFFDIHVCNWPERPLFFLILFSSYEFKNISKIEIFTPRGLPIGEMDLNKFQLKQKKGKPDKKVFINHFEIPQQAVDGWYSATVTMKNGKQYRAEDFVVLRKMQRASNIVPADGAENVKLPVKLTWDPIPGAKFYKVYIRDNWEDVSVFESELLTKPELVLSRGTLAAGGYYSWRIHARDENENVLLGDFNHGSLTSPMTFTVATDGAAQNE